MYALIHKSDRTSAITVTRLSRDQTTSPSTAAPTIETVPLAQLKAIIAIAKRTSSRKMISSRLSKMFRKHQITEIIIIRCLWVDYLTLWCRLLAWCTVLWCSKWVENTNLTSIGSRCLAIAGISYLGVWDLGTIWVCMRVSFIFRGKILLQFHCFYFLFLWMLVHMWEMGRGRYSLCLGTGRPFYLF